VRDFDVEHTERVHVILVGRDPIGFQHVHPWAFGCTVAAIPRAAAGFPSR